MKIEFWFYAQSMESGEDFWAQYYNGSTWRTVASYASGNDFKQRRFPGVSLSVSLSKI